MVAAPGERYKCEHNGKSRITVIGCNDIILLRVLIIAAGDDGNALNADFSGDNNDDDAM